MGADGIFPILHPVGKAADDVYILAGSTVEEWHRRFSQHEGIFEEGLVLLRSDVAVDLLRSVKQLGGQDFCVTVQGKAVEGRTFQKADTVWTAGGGQNPV